MKRDLISLALIGVIAFWATLVGERLMTPSTLAPAFHDPSIYALFIGFLSARWAALYLLLCVLFVLPLRLAYRVPVAQSAAFCSMILALASLGKLTGIETATGFGKILLACCCGLLAILAASRLSDRMGLSAGLLQRVGVAVAVFLIEVCLVHWAAGHPLRGVAHERPTATLVLLTCAVIGFGLGAAFFEKRRAAAAAILAPVVLGAITLNVYSVRATEPHTEPVIGQVPGPIQNVILIVVDTLRADRVSSIDPERKLTPRIDELAADSVVFERAVSAAPWTFPAMESIMTGLPQYEDRKWTSFKTAAAPNLAELMSNAGYFSAGVTANPLPRRPMRFVSGFEELQAFSFHIFGNSVFGKAANSRFPRYQWTSTAAVTTSALDWLEHHYSKPFFLWAHYLDPHAFYLPPDEYLPPGVQPTIRESLSDYQFADSSVRAEFESLYDAEVRYVDAHVGRLLDRLRELGLYESSLIILTSDHGEEFWEHGGFSHGQSLHKEVLHVPLVVHSPSAPGGRRISSFVPTRAILPTILDLCGISVQPDQHWSPSLAPLVRGEKTEWENPIFSGGTRRDEFQRSVIFDDMKFILRLFSGREELYDLETDPRETRSVLEQHPDAAKRARELIREGEERADEIRARYGLNASSDANASEEALDRMRSLGYIQ